MLLGVAADWQDVIIAALTLAGVIVNGLVSVYIVTRVRVPSGGKIGEVMERTHANSAVTAAAIPVLLEHKNGEPTGSEPETPKGHGLG